MKGSIFLDVSPCSLWKSTDVSEEHGSACYLSHVGFLLGLFFNHEDREDMFLRTTRRYIPENRTLHKHHCENLKSCKDTMFETWTVEHTT
jgi:hypothetical protein